MKCAALFVTDVDYFALTRHAAAVFMLNNPAVDIVIYCDGFAPPSGDALTKAGAARNVIVTYAELPGNAYSFDKKNHVSQTSLRKFDAICHSLKDYERVIYLDGDILVFFEIPLSSLDFGGHPIAAVYDIAEVGGVTDPLFRKNAQANRLSPHYFNSGVIIADASRWNETHLRPLYDDLVRQHDVGCGFKADCGTADQCVLNLLFRDNWKRLPLSYNMQATAMFCEHWVDAPVRHYVGRKKFLPAQHGRNDSKDLKAINEARALLGFGRVTLAAPDLCYRLNKLRHTRANRRIRAAIEAAELLYPLV